MLGGHIPNGFWVVWEGAPYRSHSLGDGSKCRRRKGLKPICIAHRCPGVDEKATGEESTLGRRHPNISEGENLVEKIDESGFGEVKTLTSDVPTLLDYSDFKYDSFSLIDCITLLQSMINSPHAYEQNKAFTKHIVDAIMKDLEQNFELEV